MTIKWLIVFLVVLLTIYAPLELTRVVLWHIQTYPEGVFRGQMELELLVMWFFYISAILVLNWRLKSSVSS